MTSLETNDMPGGGIFDHYVFVCDKKVIGVLSAFEAPLYSFHKLEVQDIGTIWSE